MVVADDSVPSTKYKMEVSFGSGDISGIMAVKLYDNAIIGTAINEFGVKLFDFVNTKNKCKLKNVASLMNKWYVRRTMENDLHTIFEKNDIASQAAEVEFVNEKRGITYKLTKLRE